jgi:hypothetical protein
MSNIVPKKSQRLGSWGQAVKLTGTGSDWDDDDLPLTVEALNGTNQNLYIYTIDTQSDWENFLKLLDAVSDSDIKLFAAMQSPTDEATVTHNRWGVKGLKPKSCAQTGDLSQWECERDAMLTWLDAWRRAAEILSALSVCHPNLVGFLIDDFSGFVESVDQPQCMFGRKLSRADVQSIADACASVNPAFGFWPAYQIGSIGQFDCSGYILGLNYGTKLHNNEYMTATVTFTISADAPHAPSPFDLILGPKVSFFHSTPKDFSGELETKAFERAVILDDNTKAPVWGPYGCPGMADITYTELRLGALNAGPHKLQFKLSATAQSNVEVQLFWRIWGLTIEERIVSKGPLGHPTLGDYSPVAIDSEDFQTSPAYAGSFPVAPTDGVCLAGTYAPADSGMGYLKTDCISNADQRGFNCALPDSAIDGRQLGRLVAAPNRSYLIGDIVAGFAPYTGTTDTSNGWMEDNTVDAQQDAYKELLQALVASLGDDNRLMAIHQAMLTGTVIDPTVLTTWLTVAAQVSKYTAVWNYPLGLYFLKDKKGIFREPDRPSWYSFTAFYPGRQPTLEGFYQRWLGGIPLFGVDAKYLSITVSLLTDGAAAEIFTASIKSDVGATLWSKDVADLDLPATFGFAITESGTLSLRFSFELVGGIWDQPTRVKFAVSEAGLVSPASFFMYQTGVSDSVVATYDAVRLTYG